MRASRGPVLAALLVLGSAWPGRAADAVEWTYLCPDGSMFFAATGRGAATVHVLGTTLTLPLAPSGSGARYADTRWVLWNKGRVTGLERQGKPLFVDCLGAPSSERRPAPGWGTIRGTASYRERMALPPTAVLEVRLGDVSRPDVPEIRLAEVRLPIEQPVPIAFELRYDPALVDPRMRYQVRARIVDGERLLFITDRAYPVITGYPNQVELLVTRVAASSPSPAASLLGPPWQLRRLGVPGQPEVTPADPSLYTLQFLDRGRVGVRADCNSGSGPYNVDGPKLSLGGMAISLAACGPGSHDRAVLRALSQVESYRLQGATLELQLRGGGLLAFRRAAGG